VERGLDLESREEQEVVEAVVAEASVVAEVAAGAAPDAAVELRRTHASVIIVDKIQAMTSLHLARTSVTARSKPRKL